MKYKSALMTEASGSIGGITASRNAGGAYFRARVVPINPSSLFQQAVRSYLALIASIWATVLTPTARTSWHDYATNVPLNDSLGDSRTRSGIAHYTRANVPRLQAGLDRVDDAPVLFVKGPTPNAAALELAVVGDDIALQGDVQIGAPIVAGHLLVYQGIPQNPSRNFYKGPWRYVDKVEFAADDTVVSLDLSTWPYAMASGQRCSFRFTTTLETGQLSSQATVALIVPS